MVTSRIVSQFTGELPQLGTDRKIKGLKCPLYEPAAILGILEQQQPILLQGDRLEVVFQMCANCNSMEMTYKA